MITFKNKIITGDFLSNLSVLTLGTLVSQAIVFIFYPILARIYTPAEFGVISLVYMLSSLLAVFASGAAEGAIVISKSRTTAVHVIGWIVIRSTLVFLSFFIITIFLFKVNISIIAKEVLLWLPVVPLFAASIIYFNCINEWLLIENNLLQMTRLIILQSLAVSSIRSFLGIFNFLINGLVIGEILGKLITIFIGLSSIFNKHKQYFLSLKLIKIESIKRKYKDFPKYMMPDQLINIIGGTIHIPFLSLAFGVTELGYISMSMSILYFPVSVISSAIKDVFRQQATIEFKLTGSCRKLYLKLLLPVSLIGLIGFGIIYILSSKLFLFLLGDAWIPVGEYVKILTPLFFLNFVSMSMGGVLIITQQLKISLSWQIINTTMTLLAIIIGVIYFQTVIATLWGVTIAKSFAYLIHIFISYHFSDSSAK